MTAKEKADNVVAWLTYDGRKVFTGGEPYLGALRFQIEMVILGAIEEAAEVAERGVVVPVDSDLGYSKGALAAGTVIAAQIRKLKARA